MDKIKQFFQILGPGFITGASDDDPSGVATYSQTGAQFGYAQLWTSIFSFPFMAIIQEICGRIGMVTGKGLSAILKDEYSKTVLYVAVLLLLIANTINVGADLGAMASSINLIVPIPFPILLILATAITLILEIFLTYSVYAKYLKYLTLALFAYIITAFVIKEPWKTIAFSSFLPTISFNQSYLLNIVAILGTTISPYLFFWQTDEEVEEEVAHHRIKAMGRGVPKVMRKDIREMRLDTVIGMLFSNLVMFFIIVVTASTLHTHGLTTINTADQAALALKPFAGNLAFFLFAIGIIGTGLLAVPVLAGSAAYALSEAFNWKAGLALKLRQAHGFYGVIAIATLLGLIVNFTPIKPFQLLYYTAVVNGIAAPPLMFLIMIVSNNKKIMGTHTNNIFSNIFGWVITAIMAIAGIALIISLF